MLAAKRVGMVATLSGGGEEDGSNSRGVEGEDGFSLEGLTTGQELVLHGSGVRIIVSSYLISKLTKISRKICALCCSSFIDGGDV